MAEKIASAIEAPETVPPSRRFAPEQRPNLPRRSLREKVAENPAPPKTTENPARAEASGKARAGAKVGENPWPAPPKAAKIPRPCRGRNAKCAAGAGETRRGARPAPDANARWQVAVQRSAAICD